MSFTMHGKVDGKHVSIEVVDFNALFHASEDAEIPIAMSNKNGDVSYSFAKKSEINVTSIDGLNDDGSVGVF